MSYMPIGELSAYLGIPKWTLYQWVSQRRIPHYKLGGLLRFKREEIEDWARGNFIGVKSYNGRPS